MKTIFAKITTSFEDTHQYPGAPKEVDFLKYPHRHIFHVTVYIEQFHNNRDIEFIIFKRWVDKTIFSKVRTMKTSKSCEMMAETLHEAIIKKFGKRKVKIEVSEDKENGALIEFD